MANPKLVVDAHGEYRLIEALEKMPELFPTFDVEELGTYDDDLGEFIQCGDFTNEYRSWVGERKTIHIKKHGRTIDGDFKSSLTSHRLQDQMAKMNIYYSGNRHLLCEGYLVNFAAMNPSLRQYAYSMVGHCGNMGINFKECYDIEEMLEVIYWINRESGKEPLLRADVKTEGKNVIPQLAGLSKIPGVGARRAKMLIRKYGSINGIFLNLEALDVENAGIGPKIRDAVKDFYFKEVILPDVQS